MNWLCDDKKHHDYCHYYFLLFGRSSRQNGRVTGMYKLTTGTQMVNHSGSSHKRSCHAARYHYNTQIHWKRWLLSRLSPEIGDIFCPKSAKNEQCCYC